jgi:gas vesicle protein
MKSVLPFALGTLIGALIGSALALLFAPSSGEELRANIKSKTDTQYARLQDEWQKGKQEIDTRMDKLSSKVQSVTSKEKGTGTPA